MVPHISGRDRDLLGEPSRKRSSLSGKSQARNSFHIKTPKIKPDLQPQSTSTVCSLTTMRDKRQCFLERDVIMCPSSPPIPENLDMSEEESLKRSRERIATISRRMSELPLCRVRCSVNLACTQLRGPFSEGCRYWGIAPPVKMRALNKSPVIHPIASTSQSINLPPPSLQPQHVQKRPDVPSHTEYLILSDSPVPHPPILPIPTISTAPSISAVRSAPDDLPPPLPSTPPIHHLVEVQSIPAKTGIRGSPPTGNSAPPWVRTVSTPSPNLPPPRILSQIPNALHPPETPKSQASQAFPHPPTRIPSSAIRWSSRPISTGFPTASQTAPKYSTPVRRHGSPEDEEPLSRESSPLLRFSQLDPSRIVMGTPSQRPPLPRFSPDKILSQRGSSGDGFFNSQFNFDRELNEISNFMEDDIAN
ncbi:hypothetical protein BDV93DRAFT_528417 [Ceratobasidium sp. AG-I]|nr:hypothetical protein BDV93DRAFT_528417 [Ceratobasidium sp. AG-I]